MLAYPILVLVNYRYHTVPYYLYSSINFYWGTFGIVPYRTDTYLRDVGQQYGILRTYVHTKWCTDRCVTLDKTFASILCITGTVVRLIRNNVLELRTGIAS